MDRLIVRIRPKQVATAVSQLLQVTSSRKLRITHPSRLSVCILQLLRNGDDTMPSFRASAQKEIYGIKKHQRNSCGISLRDSNITDFPESRGLTEMGIVSRRLTSAQLAFYHAREREEEASWPSTTQTKATAIVYTSVCVWAHDIILRFPSPPLPRLRNERTRAAWNAESELREIALPSVHILLPLLSLLYIP